MCILESLRALRARMILGMRHVASADLNIAQYTAKHLSGVHMLSKKDPEDTSNL